MYLFLSQQQAIKHGVCTPHHQPKQLIWNLTNHNHGPSTAMPDTKPIATAISFKQLFKELTSESLLRSPLVSSLHLLADAMRQRCNSWPHLQSTSSTYSSITKSQTMADQFQHHQATTPASSNRKHLHHPSPWATTLLKLAPALQGHTDIPLIN